MTTAEDELWELRQGGWGLERYVEEFLELSNRVSWHDASLGTCFHLGLNDKTIRCELPTGSYPLIELINLVLFLNGSDREVETVPKSCHPAPAGTSSASPAHPMPRTSAYLSNCSPHLPDSEDSPSSPLVPSSSSSSPLVPSSSSSSPLVLSSSSSSPLVLSSSALSERPRDAALPERPPVPVPSGSPEPLPVPSGSPEPLPVPSGSPEPLLVPSGSPEPLLVPSGSPEPLLVPSGSPEPLPFPSGSPEPLATTPPKSLHVMKSLPKKILGGGYPPWRPPKLPAPLWPPESPDPPGPPKLPAPPWPPESPDPPWPPELPDPPWSPELPDPPWPPELPDPPWPPELPDPPWPPESPDPPWPPELPDPPWPPELPDPPWPPEVPPLRRGRPSFPLRHGSWNGRRPGGLLSCPVSVSREASRAPTPPPLSMLYGAGRAYWEGGVMSDFVSLCLVFPYPCVMCPYLVLPVSCHH